MRTVDRKYVAVSHRLAVDRDLAVVIAKLRLQLLDVAGATTLRYDREGWGRLIDIGQVRKRAEQIGRAVRSAR